MALRTVVLWQLICIQSSKSIPNLKDLPVPSTTAEANLSCVARQAPPGNQIKMAPVANWQLESAARAELMLVGRSRSLYLVMSMPYRCRWPGSLDHRKRSAMQIGLLGWRRDFQTGSVLLSTGGQSGALCLQTPEGEGGSQSKQAKHPAYSGLRVLCIAARYFVASEYNFDGGKALRRGTILAKAAKPACAQGSHRSPWSDRLWLGHDTQGWFCPRLRGTSLCHLAVRPRRTIHSMTSIL